MMMTDLLDAFEGPAMTEGQVVHQEVFLSQQIGYELAILVPPEWVEVCSVR